VFSDHELRARLRPRDSRRSTSSVLTNLAAAPGVRPTGRDRCLPRANHRRQGHRLGPHRRALRRPGSSQPLPRRRAKPRRRGRPGVRPSGGAGHRAAPVRRRRASRVPPATCSAAPGAWSCPAALPPGGIVDQQHLRTRDHAASRGRVRRPTRGRELCLGLNPDDDQLPRFVSTREHPRGSQSRSSVGCRSRSCPQQPTQRGVHLAPATLPAAPDPPA
jgi:hypothetical protein